MRRRDFIAYLGGAVVPWPLSVHAQQPDRIKRLGILRGIVDTDFVSTSDLLQGLAQLGWTEGRNLRVDHRLTGSNDGEAARPHAESLVRTAPDAIFASSATIVQVLQKLTRTIPIVFVQNGDPVQAGTVQSLARPGGNLTGFLNSEPSLNTKYLQLLKDIAPQVSRAGVLQSQATTVRGDFAVIEAVARSFGVQATSLAVRDDLAEIDRAIAAFAREPNGGLILPGDAATNRHRALIVELAAKHRLPAVYSNRQFVDAGGLLSYSAAPLDYRAVAGYVDRILRGAKPADLPVQLPSKYELVIKLKAATDLGLTIPPSMFALADEVIE
jgi:putative tryptophan/tyrosine transport system substrate-binding protein